MKTILLTLSVAAAVAAGGVPAAPSGGQRIVIGGKENETDVWCKDGYEEGENLFGDCGIRLEYVFQNFCPEGSRPSLPDCSKPEETQPETSAPVITETENSAPEMSAPETSAPETSVPETTAPETSAPGISAPETSSPETSAPETEKPSAPSEENTGSSESVHPYILRIVELVNEERAKAGLHSVTLDTAASQAAYVRAKEIVKSFSHTRPDGRSCFTALTEAQVRYRLAGENIAWGQRTPEQVMEGWMNSPGHRANILRESFTHIGVGYYQENGVNYWTQMFFQ